MRYVLDTSALLAHYRQEPGWQDVQALFEAEEAELIVASVSLTEFGRCLRELGAAEAEVEDTLSDYQLLFTEVVPIDTVVAMAAMAIGFRTSRRLPLVDALITAVAQVRAAVLVHRDEHMRSMPAGLVDLKELATSTHEA